MIAQDAVNIRKGMAFLLSLPHFAEFRKTHRGRQILQRMNLQDIW